jgi:hypothetical protein
MLIDGSLTAYGRQDIIAGISSIPAYAWRHLKFVDLMSGTVSGAGKKFYDVRIAKSGPLSAGRHVAVDQSQQHTEARSVHEDLSMANEAKSETTEGPCGKPLQIAVDESTKTVTVVGFGKFTGRNFDLILSLWRKAKEEYREGRMPEKYQCTNPDKLAGNLCVELATIRRIISNCRSTFIKMYLAKCGKEPSQDMTC